MCCICEGFGAEARKNIHLFYFGLHNIVLHIQFGDKSYSLSL